MKMRLAWYAGASTALAGAVVVSAFHQRANFYSAMVHLAQSSLSLMILVNLVFLIYGSFVYGLQRLLFGQLRPIEIESLYEKAWFAVTETCLAMTIFRDEVGAFFLVMFTALVTGKVWGWIGEGRVEVLEQQPPANPWLFHTRLSISLLISVIYDVWLLSYAVRSVVQEARPTMMVMFLFEFSILTVLSTQTGLRYIVSLVEQRIIRKQTHQRLEERRRQIREQRAEILRRRETEGTEEGEEQEPLPNEEDIDEMDIEVPGWQTKGQWVLSLDLFADFVKLLNYVAFFVVLLMFYGLPIHILRDLFLTTKSFFKRLKALGKYLQALKDMDQYPDASEEELAREDTCIICREEMRPWDPNQAGQVERSRPKKLPCGHILHFGCLKSWLERQQVCPTCRRSVVQGDQAPARNGEAIVFRLGLGGRQNQQPPANGQAPGAAAGGQPAPGDGQNGQPNNRNGLRIFNLGPLRLGFAQGGVQDIQGLAQQFAQAENPAAAPAAPPQPAQPTAGNNNNNPASLDHILAQLQEVSQRVRQEMQTLQQTANEAVALNFMVQELNRLRQMRDQQQQLRQEITQIQQQQQPAQPPAQQSPQPNTPAQAAPGVQAAPGAVPALNGLGQAPVPQPPAFPPAFPQAHAPQHTLFFQQPPAPFGGLPPFQQPPAVWAGIPPFQLPPQFMPQPPRAPPPFTRHGATGYGAAIPAGSPDLPEGVVIPPGWSLLPLQRLDGSAQPPVPSAPAEHFAPPPRGVSPFMGANDHPEVQSMIDALRGARQAPHAVPAPAPPSTSAPTTQPHGVETTAESASPAPAPIPEQQSQPAQQPAQDRPQVTAPTPVAANWNWGGNDEFLGANNNSIFGLQVDNPVPQESAAASSSAAEAGRSEAVAGANATPEAGARADQNGSNSSDKGKSRAVTVEEDEEEDDE